MKESIRMNGAPDPQQVQKAFEQLYTHPLQAEKQYRTWIKQYSAEPWMIQGLSQSLLVQKKYTQALSSLTHFFQNPSFQLLNAEEKACLYHQAAHVCKNTNQTDQAISYYQLALQEQPHHVASLLNLANLYQEHHFRLSESFYQQVLRIDSNHGHARYALGILYLKHDQWELALSTFQHASLKKHAKAHFYAGFICSQSDHLHEMGLAHYQTSLSIEPDFETQNHYASLLHQLHRYEEALRQWADLLRQDPLHEQAKSNAAATLFMLQRYEQAAMHYRNLVEAYPHHDEYRYHLGVSLMPLGHLEEAIECLQSSKHIDAQVNMAACYWRLNQKEKAFDIYQNILKQNPHHPIAEHMVASYTKKSTERAPGAYIQQLFDPYAEHFESHALHTLQCRAHEHVFWMMQDVLSSDFFPMLKQPIEQQKWMDLGCGTGLFGQHYRSQNTHRCPYLIGMDIAPNMLSKAQPYYHQLEQGNFCETWPIQPMLDGIVACDSLCYTGCLDALIEHLHSHLRGWFIATFECPDSECHASTYYALQSSGRYGHDLEHTCIYFENREFQIKCIQRITLRYNPEPIHGWVVAMWFNQ